jgi:hypothetical protein
MAIGLATPLSGSKTGYNIEYDFNTLVVCFSLWKGRAANEYPITINT